jgi:hypothetical protein
MLNSGLFLQTIVALMKIDPTLPLELRKRVQLSRKMHVRLINALAMLVPA